MNEMAGQIVVLEEDYERLTSLYKGQIAFYEKAAERVVEFMILFQGVYFTAISFSQLKQMQGALHLTMGFMLFFLLPVGFFFLAMSSAMYVILMTKGRPDPTKPPPTEEERSERLDEWENWRDRKHNALHWSYIFTALAFLSLFIAMGVYLVYLPGTP